MPTFLLVTVAPFVTVSLSLSDRGSTRSNRFKSSVMVKETEGGKETETVTVKVTEQESECRSSSGIRTQEGFISLLATASSFYSPFAEIPCIPNTKIGYDF